jgi:hypothetical protein
VREGMKYFLFCILEFPSSLIHSSDHLSIYLRLVVSLSFSYPSGFIDLFLGNLFIIEITNPEVYIIMIIFVLLGFLAWETPIFYINCPNWFQSIWGLCLLLRSWFPTSGISLLFGKLRSRNRLISFHCSHLVHTLIMHLNKPIIHLVYLLSQESNWIRNIVVGNLHP